MRQKTWNIENTKMKESINDKLNKNNHETELWSVKYKPTNMMELIGNIELAKKLKVWLLEWNKFHIQGTKKTIYNRKLNENISAKTVLISGPPGIGKTTLANLVGKDCGFQIYELNASDARNKKILQEELGDVVQSQAISFSSSKNNKKSMPLTLVKRLVIMDEVDGMSNGDRGGMTELINIIKKSKIPIICICNDRQSMKVRTLANISYDLRARRPTKSQIVNRLKYIAERYENMHIDSNALDEAVERFGNDIRQIFNWLQMWSKTNNKMAFEDVKSTFHQMEKDDLQRLNIFTATQQIFQTSTLKEKVETYFTDYDMMPLMVQENYLRSIQNSNKNLEMSYHDSMSSAADYIAESDIVSVYVRQQSRWDLLTTQAALNAGACFAANGYVGNVDFTSWLGRNSTVSKAKRLVGHLAINMRSHASGTNKSVRLDYIPCMKDIFLCKLYSKKEKDINDVIQSLDDCDLSKDDLTESFEFFKLNGIMRNTYSGLDTKTKTAFTRKYNQKSHTSQAVVEASLQSLINKKKGKSRLSENIKGEGTSDIVDEDNDDTNNEENEKDDDDIHISLFQVKKNEVKKRKTGTQKNKNKPLLNKKQKKS